MWITERPRTYSETIDAWKSSCPRLTVWEDAVSDRLVRVERGRVRLTGAGTELLAQRVSWEKTRSAEICKDRVWL